MVVSRHGEVRERAVEPTGTVAPAREPVMRHPADRQPAPLDALLAGGNRAVAGMLAPLAFGGASGPRILRSPDDPPAPSPDYDVSVVIVYKVPAGLAGEELRVHVLMRLGDMSREDALALLEARLLTELDPRYNADGTVTVGLSGREPELIRSWKSRRSATAADIDLDADADEETTVERVALVVTDIVTDFTPGVSNVKDATIALTGVNPVTGEEVGFFGRVTSAIFAIPGLGNVLKILSKGGRLLARAIVVLAKGLDRIAQRMPGLVRRLWEWMAGKGVADELPDALPGPSAASPAASGAGGAGAGGGGTGGGAPSVKEPPALAEGKRKHKEHADKASTTPMEAGWEPLSIEKNLELPSGKVIRPDAIYVNHASKEIIIEDVFTGADEPLKHKLKTWLGARSTLIQDLLNKGYKIKAVVTAHWHPSSTH